MRMAHCCGLSGPKKGCGCWEQHAAPLVTKLSIALMRWARSRSKSHCAGCAEKSSGEDGELRRIGLSLPKTRGFMSGPMTLAGKDARLGLMTPVAIRMPNVQCARVWARVMLRHRRALSGWRRTMRFFMPSARVGPKISFLIGTLRLGGIVASGPNNFSLFGGG